MPINASMNEQLWYIHAAVEHNSAMNENELLVHAGLRMFLRLTMLT